GWSHYFQEFLGILKINLPARLTNAPFDYNPDTGQFSMTGKYLDVPAILIAGIVTVILVIGIRERGGFNAAMVGIQGGSVVMVIITGGFYINSANWKPFAPFGLSGVSFFGKTLLGETGKGGEPLGMLAGAATIFFAYIGFDSVSTHAEEARKPQKDVPI